VSWLGSGSGADVGQDVLADVAEHLGPLVVLVGQHGADQAPMAVVWEASAAPSARNRRSIACQHVTWAGMRLLSFAQQAWVTAGARRITGRRALAL
jgi:hypothetical protein